MTDTAQVNGRLRVAVQIEKSPTGALDQLVKKMLATGIDVARLNGGDIDHPPPAAAQAAAEAAVREPGLARYTSNAGLPGLRSEIASWYTELGIPVGAEDVVVTNGAKHAISLALRLVLDPGSEVILPTPQWPTFPAAVGLAGGVPVPAERVEGPGAPLNRHALDAVVTERTRALILVTPDNPSGRSTGSAEFDEICDWAQERGIWVIVDQTYAGLEYERVGNARPGAPTQMFRENVIRIGTVSKTFCVPGWRVGWLIGSPEVARTGAAIHSHTVSHVSNLAQMGAVGALQARSEFLPQLLEKLRKRRDALCEELEDINGVRLVRPAGGIYAFADVREALKRLKYRSTQEMAERILETHRVAVLPGEAFGAPGWLRLSFGGTETANRVGTDRLRAVLTEWERR